MSTRYLHLVRMDVAHDHEAIFNDIYDHEHIPALLAVPGVARASRYRHPSPTDPRYLAAYELESPAVLQSPQWKAAAESGRWPKDVRPHTMNRHIATYEWVGSSKDLTMNSLSSNRRTTFSPSATKMPCSRCSSGRRIVRYGASSGDSSESMVWIRSI